VSKESYPPYFSGEAFDYSLEKRYIRKDGTVVWGNLTASPLWEPGEQVAEYLHIAIVKDMSDRKNIETELRKSEEQYRLLTENIKDVVWILDTQTMYFRYISPSVEKLRGYTPEEILAEPVTKALTPEGAEYIANQIRQNVADIRSGVNFTDKFFIEEVEQPCKDGSTIWTEAVTNYYVNPENGKVEVRGVTRDISERKRAEAQIKKQLHDLKHWQQVMLGREERVIELKKEVNTLLTQNGKPPRFLTLPSEDSAGIFDAD